MTYDHKATEEQAGTLKDQVLEILSEHVGADSAIKAKDIARRLGLTGKYSDRPVREAVKQLRREGHLVISSVTVPYGYFLAATEEEWLEFRDRNLRPRAMDILETSRAMGLAAKGRWGGAAPKIPVQVPLSVPELVA
jgi:predicted transcriptional regulator